MSNIVQQKVAQVSGVGDVEIGGGSLPAVRIDLNTLVLNSLGIPAEDVRAADAGFQRDAAQGQHRERRAAAADLHAAARPHGRRIQGSLTVAWRNGAAVKLSDIANVTDGPEDVRTLGLFNGSPAVIVIVTRQPGANIIDTVDGVRALLPELKAQLPSDIDLQVASDSTNSIRASLHEVEATLLISVALVVLVVGVFLHSLARDAGARHRHRGVPAGNVRRHVPARTSASTTSA